MGMGSVEEVRPGWRLRRDIGIVRLCGGRHWGWGRGQGRRGRDRRGRAELILLFCFFVHGQVDG